MFSIRWVADSETLKRSDRYNGVSYGQVKYHKVISSPFSKETADRPRTYYSRTKLYPKMSEKIFINVRCTVDAANALPVIFKIAKCC